MVLWNFRSTLCTVVLFEKINHLLMHEFCNDNKNDKSCVWI